MDRLNQLFGYLTKIFSTIDLYKVRMDSQFKNILLTYLASRSWKEVNPLITELQKEQLPSAALLEQVLALLAQEQPVRLYIAVNALRKQILVAAANEENGGAGK